jgi:hypothetical protein
VHRMCFEDAVTAAAAAAAVVRQAVLGSKGLAGCGVVEGCRLGTAAFAARC